MPVLKRLSDSIFGWISPRTTHEKRDIKPFRASNVKLPARAKTKARIPPGAKPIGIWKPQAATSALPLNVDRGSGIPWEEIPSSPTAVETIEERLAATALYADDDMEDAGDEGAVGELSEDDSGLLDTSIEEGEALSDEDTEEEGSELEVGSDAEEEEGTEVQEGSDVEEEEGLKVKVGSDLEVAEVSDVEDGSQDIDVKEESESEEDEDEKEEEDEEEEEETVYDANRSTKLIDLEEDREAALVAATHQLEIDREAKFQEQQQQFIEMQRDGWNVDTILLYLMIDRRTLETLLPLHWKTDFPQFPFSVFTNEYPQAFLGGKRPNNDWIVNKALLELLKLPVHIRNQIRIKAWYGRRAEAMVVRYCEEYQKFINKDCKLFVPIKKKRMKSLICYAAGDEKKDTPTLEAEILTKLRKRAAEVLDLLRLPTSTPKPPFTHDGTSYIYEPPTLWGIVAKEAVIALVAYEPLSKRDAVRIICFFHMSKPQYDVWNALALAIVMVWCRNHLYTIKQRIKEYFEEDLDELRLTDDEG